MCVLEDAREVAIAQAFAVARQQLARLRANDAGTNRGVARGDEVGDGAPKQVERFVAREALAGDADGLGYLRELRLRLRTRRPFRTIATTTARATTVPST